MRQVLLGVAVLLLFLSVAHAQQFSGLNFTASEANMTISHAYTYVNTINESGFFIFQPNLTSSYKYLAIASSIYNASPNSAVFYAEKAESIASQQYADISYYKSGSLPVIVIMALAFLAILLKVMVPVKKTGRKGRR